MIRAALASILSCLIATDCFASARGAPVLTAVDLEAWLDGFFPFALQQGDVAGAVVVVVKDGQVLLQKGYGFADVKGRRAVDPQTTLFRPGSVSKLFTWTAVMQLVEKGRLDLDQDVNRYLDFNVPPLDGQPITLRHLMTHTSGFEYSLRDLVTTDSARRLPLAEYLKQRLPARIFNVGKVPAYSNYGAALAGYIVQRVSGVPFEDYVDREIFAPLNMKSSTFREPLPATWQGRMSTAYERASAGPRPFEYLIAPAGGSAMTGTDMGNFMLAYLQQGAFAGRQLLQDGTMREMLESGVTPIPSMQHPMHLGFFDVGRNGRHIIGHEGDTIWYHSVLQLYPDEHVGLFVSMNSSGNAAAARSIRAGLLDGFTDRYFPPAGEAPRSVPDSGTSGLVSLLGSYESSQQEPNGFLSLVKLITQSTVFANPDGSVSVSSIHGPNGEVRKYKQISRLNWHEVDGTSQLAARAEADKVVMWAQDDGSADNVYLPVPWWRDARWLLPAIVASIAWLMLRALAWPIAECIRLRRRAELSVQVETARGKRWVRWISAAAAVLFLIWFVVVGTLVKNLQWSTAIVPWIIALRAVSLVAFPVAAVAALWNARISGWWRWNGVSALGCLTLLWAAVVYRLSGFGAQF